ncbi:ATP-binding protein [Mycobacterium sp. NPDC048908]|uniref:ATP-binding protein n=1 Tax=Mycobacterium sp. NPDC048908 TaxID=3364292 RepID=UPI003713D6C1
MNVLTFLFTDIEGSTRRWEADAESMRMAIDAHNTVLREAVELNGGTVFNYTGDGMCAVFASPGSAVEAAIGAQRLLALPVRMGIATGEAELRDGDYFGTVLNRTARVMAAGHGGQILVDAATAALLGGVDLLDLGLRQLRDIAKPVALYQVRAPDLPSNFPPLNTSDATPGNLPRSTTSFIGRDSELTELVSALKEHRLLTLTGVGGVGKTRLALEVGAKSAHDYPDGVFVIELAAVGDPAAVPEAVAAVLGITQQTGMTLTESIATALERRSRLLIFDNCEHVIDAAADVIEAILAHSTEVRIIATSREGLRLTDEQLWPVPSLDVNSNAATLFVERALSVAPAAALDRDTDVITDICRRLDGIPLAIELAASRLLSMTVSEIRGHLDDRFRLLVGSRRGLERHQTLRHAVQWSYDLLGADEKTLLTHCSVFAGGFDVAGAHAITGSDDKFATLDLLDALVRKSLLVADQSSGRTRFTMLETIRQFAEEQLVAGGQADRARTAHALYFARQEAKVLTLWDGPRQAEAYDWFITELANLRVAFRWSSDHDDLDAAAAIASCGAHLGTRVEQYEPVAWAEELLDRAKVAEHPRLAQLYNMAAQCYAAGRAADAVEYADAALALIEDARFDEIPYAGEAWLGGVYLSEGRPEQFVQVCRDMIARHPDNHFALACLTLALTTMGAPDEAVELSKALPTVAEAARNPEVASYILLAYGIAQRDVDPEAAYDAHRKGSKIAQDTGNRQLETFHAGNLARIAAFHGEPIDALDYATSAVRRFYNSGSFWLAASGLAVLSGLFDRLQQYEAAAILSACGTNPFAVSTYPELQGTIGHLREVLGDDTYESFRSIGEAKTDAALIAFAFEQIDITRARLQQT